MAEALPPYSGHMPACKKCGHFGADTEYLPTGMCLHLAGERHENSEINERLHRTCQRCGYTWDEAVLR